MQSCSVSYRVTLYTFFKGDNEMGDNGWDIMKYLAFGEWNRWHCSEWLLKPSGKLGQFWSYARGFVGNLKQLSVPFCIEMISGGVTFDFSCSLTISWFIFSTSYKMTEVWKYRTIFLSSYNTWLIFTFKICLCKQKLCKAIFL